LPRLITKSAYAKKHGWRPSYVTKLIGQGRVVVVSGKVDEKKSDELIEKTKDLAREHRRKKVDQDPRGPNKRDRPEHVSDFHRAKTAREQWAAKNEQIKYEVQAGTLVKADEVKKAWEKFCSVLRTNLRTIPRQLAPLLEGKDPHEIEKILRETIDQRLQETAENPLGEDAKKEKTA
jgi:hypothetical protein